MFGSRITSILLLTAKSVKSSQLITATEEEITNAPLEPTITSNAPIAKPPEPSKPEEPPPYLEKSTFITPKPISHSPKISPSSIPNPNPSVTTTKQVDPGYSNYGGYIYSVPGYSAFQPVAYPGVVEPKAIPISQNESPNSECIAFSTSVKESSIAITEEKATAVKTIEKREQNEVSKTKTDFEDHFTPEIISASLTSDTTKSITDSKINVTSLTQGSGATVTIPTHNSNNDIKKKPERFSLKTSIPISKIDMKCVSNPPDSIFSNSLPKKPFNPAFHTPNIKEFGPKIDIQSNIVIKNALNESDEKELSSSSPTNNINTLINAAEALSKNELQFKIPESKTDQCNQAKESSIVPAAKIQSRPIFNPLNIEASKVSSLTTRTTDSSFNEPKNQIVFIQKNNPSNQKMLLAIQQQNPHVRLQRANYDSKNLQAPSLPSGQIKKNKEEFVNENGTSSKVVSLKRMHQDNYDENDFENLITENQIYGNKIVVKEKSQGTLQEQDLKNKFKTEKLNTTESKSIVLQPNFVYLSNVQFPGNLMMIKNSAKSNSDLTKMTTIINESKVNEIASNSEPLIKNNRPLDVSTNKDVHVLKANNKVLQTLSSKNNISDLFFQTSQKVIMNPQIVYQVPMIVDSESKLNQSLVKADYPKIISQNKRELQKVFEQNKTNEKLFITCPYQMDSKLQPKIVITNIRPNITKIEEFSSMDIYAQRKKMRRLKFLPNRDGKNVLNNDSQKIETKKVEDPADSLVTSENIQAEIYKDFIETKVVVSQEDSSYDSDYGENELEVYNSLIQEYGDSKKIEETKENDNKKIEFLAHFKLASQSDHKELCLQLQEKVFRMDAVACAFIAAGRIDCLLQDDKLHEEFKNVSSTIKTRNDKIEKGELADLKRKGNFLANLELKEVTQQQKHDYEKIWQEIEKERSRRNNLPKSGNILKQPKLQSNGELDLGGQLQILTEIKKHVNDNNNLIKKRLDFYGDDGESIKVLAEKNFSELNRLSKMADSSVKHFSGQNMRKRDLNPGFDSENIQTCRASRKYYPSINIPNISKIISLKSTESSCIVTTNQAISMDEPQNSAAGVKEMFCDTVEKVQDVGCQANTSSCWPGIEIITNTYKDYEAARKKEIVDLQKYNTSLRVESAHITRAASRDSDRARALLAERRNLANEERTVRSSIQWLYTIVDLVRNYEDKWS